MKQTTRTFIIVATTIVVLSIIKMSNANANPNAVYLSCEGTVTETMPNYKRDLPGFYSGEKLTYKVSAVYKIENGRVSRTIFNQKTKAVYLNESIGGSQTSIEAHQVQLHVNDRHTETISRIDGHWTVERRSMTNFQIAGTCKRTERAF